MLLLKLLLMCVMVMMCVVFVVMVVVVIVVAADGVRQSGSGGLVVDAAVAAVDAKCTVPQEIEQRRLRYLTPSSTQFGELGESETGIELVLLGIERLMDGDGRLAGRLQLGRLQHRCRCVLHV